MLYWHADLYDPVAVGCPDGAALVPHDKALKRAKCAKFDPGNDPSIVSNPILTLFIGRVSFRTTGPSLQRFCESFGAVKSFRLVCDKGGNSRGYAFCEYMDEVGLAAAYRGVHNAVFEGAKLIADFERSRLMPGWKPRRLGGGFGGRKESGQLRFGGRDRPFHAPRELLPSATTGPPPRKHSAPTPGADRETRPPLATSQ